MKFNIIVFMDSNYKAVSSLELAEMDLGIF